MDIVLDEAIGKRLTPMPWCGEMGGLMEGAVGENWVQQLPYLWYNCEDSAVLSVRHLFEAAGDL